MPRSGCAGSPRRWSSIFVIEGKDGRKQRTRRRLYIKAHPLPVEISVPEPHPDLKGKAPGTPLWIQADISSSEPGRAAVYGIRPREDGTAYDVVPEMVGVVDHVNQEKSLLHVVVALGIDGTWPLSDLSASAEPGMTVAVRLASHHGRHGQRARILSISPTTRRPGQNVCRSFNEEVEVTGSGLGFTKSGIFIPPHLVSGLGISGGDTVEGLAIISHDKKRGKWGMKAITAKVVV